MVEMQTSAPLVDEAVLSRCTGKASVNLRLSSIGHVGHHFLLGLLAGVPGVDEKEHAFGVGSVLEQAVMLVMAV